MPKKAKRTPFRLARIGVEGFKSIDTLQSLDLAPVTVLAGANSSGKSSMMQPLLLLKQTLDAPFDPGPLLLSDRNVRFTSADQMFFRCAGEQCRQAFAIELETNEGLWIRLEYESPPNEGIALRELRYREKGAEPVRTIRMGMTSDAIAELLTSTL